MKMKKVLAVLMSLCMTAGVVSYGAPIITQSITAQADVIESSCYSFDKSTGVMTLKGEVDGYTLLRTSFYKDDVKTITAEKGTVFPIVCMNLFSGYGACTSIDLSNVDTSNVKDMTRMFSGCGSVKTIDLSSFDTRNVTSMCSMFEGCSALTSVDLSSFNTGKVKNMSLMFRYCSSLTSLDLKGFDTSNVTNMDSMFTLCSNLKSLDLSSFDTRNVTNMSSMFDHCQSLTSLDLSSFDTSNVTTMYLMFCHCEGLTSLDVSNFDTSNVTTMYLMFCWCKSLTSLDVSNFDTRKVSDMYCMFESCQSLTSLDVSSFDTNNIWRFASMFRNCSKLKTIDISNFDISQDTSMYELFDKCTELKIISLGENFKSINTDAKLPNGDGWVNAKDTSTVISGDGEYAVIKNSGKNTYKRLPINEETKLTYPTNIKVAYSEKYHQVRFTWDKVEDADKYGIAVYLAGKWRVQNQNITGTVYTSPKNLTPGKTYKVAIAAKVNGKWDTANAIKNAVTVTIK